MKTREEKILECEEKIADFEQMLEMMPKDTIIGRLCILSYIKRERKTLEKLKNKGEKSND